MLTAALPHLLQFGVDIVKRLRKKPEHEIGLTQGLARTFDAQLLDRIARRPQARCIDQEDRDAPDIDPLFDGVPRRAGDRGDDRPLITRQGVEQR